MNLSQRRKARKLAVQALYQWQLNPEPASEIEAQFLADANPKKIDLPYFSEVVRGVLLHAASIDEVMEPALDRKINELNPVELAVLRLAIYEFLYHLEIPYKVIINEALDLAKIFGSVEGHKYVNGVLDKVAQHVRTIEFNDQKK